MEYRNLDITVISADGLKDVGLLSKMDVYVTVSLSDDPRSKCRTPVDKDGGKSPKWNHKVNLYVYEHSLPHSPAVIFTIRADRFISDKDIGEVVVPVKELLDSSNDSSERVVEYEIHTPKGKSRGKLKFSYKFGDKSTQPMPQFKAAEPMAAYPAGPAYGGGPSTAYPAPAYGTGHAYPAPPPPAGYGYPQQAAYGYPPQQQGYGGYPPQQGYGGYGGYPQQQMIQGQPQKKNNKMGLGLGIGAGLLGGLLVGDMISDMGDSSGFDGGFDL